MLGLALRDTGLALPDIRALARAADDAGFSTVWLPEGASRDALSVAALAGCSTKQARIATGVVPVYARNAVALALSAATASEACGGRFVLGIGAGHRSSAEAWFGATWSRPLVRMRETVDVVRRVLAGERVWHENTVRVDGFHLASKPPPVPVWIGALSPASLRLAGQIADGVLLNWLPAAGLSRCALIAREAAADAGRSIQVAGYVRVAVVETEDERSSAMAALRDEVYMYASLPAYASSLRLHGVAVDGMHNDNGLQRLVDALCICGDAKTVRARVDALRTADLEEIVVYPVVYGEEPAETILRTIRAVRP